MGSLGSCTLVFDSSGDPGIRPVETVCDVSSSSATEFVVRRTTSDEEAVDASTGAPVEISSSL